MGDERERAVAQYLECEATSLRTDAEDETRVLTESAAYWVLTEAESEEAFLEKIAEVNRSKPEDDPVQLSPAFLRCLGYGYTLSSYDADEGQVLVDGVPYYIYRVD